MHRFMLPKQSPAPLYQADPNSAPGGFSFGQDADESVASIVDDALDTMPQVNEQVLAQMAPTDDAPPSDDVDADGVAFNADIHAVGADGKGVRTLAGKWRKKRGQGKQVNSRVGVREKKEEPSAAVSEEQLLEEKRAKARVAAAMATQATFMCGKAFGGQEWAPITMTKEGEIKMEEYDERAMLEHAFTDYFVATGKTEVNPSLGIAVALGAYMLPRFRMPETKSRMQRAKEWMVQKYVSFKMRRKGKAENVTDGSHTGTRNDGERKDNARQTTR